MERSNVSTRRARTMSTFGVMLALAGCASEVVDAPTAVGSSSELQGARAIAFTPVTDPLGIGFTGNGEVRRVITSGIQYQRLFGHAAPAGVNFGTGDALVFYGAGVKPTGGYTVSILAIESGRGRLVVTTQLTSPAANCLVTQSVTHPFTLVKFQRPRLLARASFQRKDEVHDCSPSCDDRVCPDGQHCELVTVECIKAPCPPLPSCVDDAPKRFCGGIAGIQCPGFGKCVDDPSDSCDPDHGGADCGGMCTCVQNVLCVRGTVFDGSLDVCSCVPDPTQDPCAAVRCKAGTHCEAPDGTAECVPDAPFCGGIAGIRCPGAGSCTDNPNDDCDPKHGGADCAGLCACEALGQCIQGMIWDSSPDVCGCVPSTNPCAATLCETGTRCEVHSGEPFCVSDGTLVCGKTTCANGTQCCNASCSMCAPPGNLCIQIACAQAN